VAKAKLAVCDPATIVTELGPRQPALEDLNDTDRPPTGAGDPALSVPIVEAPPVTLPGEKLNEINLGGRTVSFADFALVPAVHKIVAPVELATGTVDTVNDAVELPEGTVTELGNETADTDELRETTSPVFPAALESVSLPAAAAPPYTVAGDKLTDFIDWAFEAIDIPKMATSHRAPFRQFMYFRIFARPV
jgi:hypothetical protein